MLYLETVLGYYTNRLSSVLFVGLSMYMLDSKWPTIEAVTGVDLSTYKLAVCLDKKSMMVLIVSYL